MRYSSTILFQPHPTANTKKRWSQLPAGSQVTPSVYRGQHASNSSLYLTQELRTHLQRQIWIDWNAQIRFVALGRKKLVTIWIFFGAQPANMWIVKRKSFIFRFVHFSRLLRMLTAVEFPSSWLWRGDKTWRFDQLQDLDQFVMLAGSSEVVCKHWKIERWMTFGMLAQIFLARTKVGWLTDL